MEKDGLPNSLVHVKIIVVHSQITNLFDFSSIFKTVLHLRAAEIIYTNVGDGSVQTST